jgi:hypothetical protein
MKKEHKKRENSSKKEDIRLESSADIWTVPKVDFIHFIVKS